MASTKPNAVFLLLAFLAGALITGIAVMSFTGSPENGPAPLRREDGPPAVRETAPPSVIDLDEAALGAPATEDELAFLRAALVTERERRKKQAEDQAVRAREMGVRPGDGGLEVVRRYLEYGADVTGVLLDYRSMRSHIQTASGPVENIISTGERTKVDLSKVAATTAVLEFGAGVFVLDRGNSSWNVRREVVESLEIRGAGMDLTTLIGPGWAFLCADKGGTLKNLSIRDLTIDAREKGQIVLDARDGISAALERVRIAGWEVAGHAAVMGVSGNGFLACRDCEFIGNGKGWVLSLRGPALALFDRCRFVNVGGALIANEGKWRPAVVRLLDCGFEDTRLTDRKLRHGSTGGAIVEVRGGSAALGSASWTEEKRLAYFNAALASSVVGLTFTSSKPRFALSDAAHVLDLVAAAGLGDVIALEVEATPTGGPVELDIYVRNEGAGAVRHTRLFDGVTLATPKEEPGRGHRGTGRFTAEDFAGIIPLSDLVRRAQSAGDEGVSSLSFRVAVGKTGEGETVRKRMLFIDFVGGGGVVLDGATGEELSRR